ncbi:unnamed protein product, partial [Rotaria sordida]
SSRYGFGLMDASLMTWYASGWKNVPPMSTCESMTYNPKKTIKSKSNETFSVDLKECKKSGDIKSQVNYIEQVQVIVNLSTTNRGEIEIYLYSPSNTKTTILPRRANDHSDQGFANWAFLTVQLWFENSHGLWKLQICNTGEGSTELISWQLIVHGTRDCPVSPRSSSETNQSNILRATGKPYHGQCFSCMTCQKSLGGMPFTVDATMQIHSIDCFHEKFSPGCYVCHRAILPLIGQEERIAIIAFDRSYHIDCYRYEVSLYLIKISMYLVEMNCF